MKILSLAQESYLSPMGGLTIYMEEVCERLQDRGHDVTWFGINQETLEAFDSKQRKYRHVCARNTLQRRNIGPLFHQMNVMEMYSLSMLEALKNESFDVIQLNDSYMYYTARMARALFDAPIVAGSHLSFGLNTASDYAEAVPEIYQYEFQQEASAFFNSTRRFTVSNVYKKQLEDLYMLPFDVIHNGVDLIPLIRAKADHDARAKYTGGKGRMFVFCGRFVEYKGVKLVMEAAKRMPNDTFVFISNISPGIETIYQLADDMKQAVKDYPNIHWEKNMKFDSKWGLMKAADAGIVGSLNSEPFGIAALEWMGLQVPLITTATGGMADFCNEENSYIIDTNVDSLVACLTNFERDESRVKNAFRTASHYSWDRTTDELEKLLTEVVDGYQSMGSDIRHNQNNNTLQTCSV